MHELRVFEQAGLPMKFVSATAEACCGNSTPQEVGHRLATPLHFCTTVLMPALFSEFGAKVMKLSMKAQAIRGKCALRARACPVLKEGFTQSPR